MIYPVEMVSRRVSLVLLCVVIATALVSSACSRKELKLQAAQLLPEPKPPEAIELNYAGNTVKLDGVKGNWALVFLGYLNCPDECPLELQKLGEMLKQFDAAGVQKIPAVAFVSVDPERDTPEQVKSYAEHFDPRIMGMSGGNTELARLAHFFGATYNRQITIKGKEYLVVAGADMPAGSGEHYQVNHSSRIFIIDPEGRYVGSFAPPHDAAVLYSDMSRLMGY